MPPQFFDLTAESSSDEDSFDDLLPKASTSEAEFPSPKGANSIPAILDSTGSNGDEDNVDGSRQRSLKPKRTSPCPKATSSALFITNTGLDEHRGTVSSRKSPRPGRAADSTFEASSRNTSTVKSNAQIQKFTAISITNEDFYPDLGHTISQLLRSVSPESNASSYSAPSSLSTLYSPGPDLPTDNPQSADTKERDVTPTISQLLRSISPESNHLTTSSLQAQRFPGPDQPTDDSPSVSAKEENPFAVITNNAPNFRYTFAEASPTPPNVDDAVWNRAFTAAHRRFYRKHGNDAKKARKKRGLGETRRLAMIVLDEWKKKHDQAAVTSLLRASTDKITSSTPSSSRPHVNIAATSSGFEDDDYEGVSQASPSREGASAYNLRQTSSPFRQRRQQTSRKHLPPLPSPKDGVRRASINTGLASFTSATSEHDLIFDRSGDDAEELAMPSGNSVVPSQRSKYRIVIRRVRKIEHALAKGKDINDILANVTAIPSQEQIDNAIHENGGTLAKPLQRRIESIIRVYNAKNPDGRLKRRFILDETSIATMKPSETKRGRQRRSPVEEDMPEKMVTNSPSPGRPSKRPKSGRRKANKNVQSPADLGATSRKVHRCSYPGCNSAFTRSDNLRTHHKKFGHSAARESESPMRATTAESEKARHLSDDLTLDEATVKRLQEVLKDLCEKRNPVSKSIVLQFLADNDPEIQGTLTDGIVVDCDEEDVETDSETESDQDEGQETLTIQAGERVIRLKDGKEYRVHAKFSAFSVDKTAESGQASLSAAPKKGSKEKEGKERKAAARKGASFPVCVNCSETLYLGNSRADCRWHKEGSKLVFEEAAIWEVDNEDDENNQRLVAGYVWDCCGAPAADEGCMLTTHKAPASYDASLLQPEVSSTSGKRQRESSPAAAGSSDSSSFATCQNCFSKFDKVKNEQPASKGECVFHWGEMQIYWRSIFWVKNGIDASTISAEDALSPEYQDGYKWSCCGKKGSAAGCRTVRHTAEGNQSPRKRARV